MSASQPALFNVQEFTDAGITLVGGRLYTYAYGTTTFKVAYTDPEGTVPQTYTADGLGGQYIALNVRGELPTPLYLGGGSYDLSLKRADASTVWTRQAGGIDGPTVGLMDTLKSADGTEIVGFRQAGVSAVLRTSREKLREGFSFKDFGAKGGGQDETALLQTAASERGGAGFGQAELMLPPGDYLIDSAPVTNALTLNSNTYVRGSGGQIRADAQDFRMLSSINKSNVRVDSMRFVAVSTPGGNDAMAAIFAGSEVDDARNMSATFNDLQDTSWGILYSAEATDGSFLGPRFIGNHVQSTVLGTKADGLHMAGRFYAAAVVGNSVRGRADAGIAMNMTSTASGYGFTVTGNASIDNLVGIDCSGSQYGVISGNVTYNTVNHAASNPCLRAISYSGKVPKYLLYSGNIAIGSHAASGEVDAKVDANGADTHITFSGNLLRTFYTNSRFVTISGNTFLGGADILIDNGAGEVLIGQNNFEGGFDIRGSGNPGLQGNVYVARQNWTRQYHPNFLPNYSSANPFWALKWFFDADIVNILSAPTPISTAVATDVTNGVFVLDRACVVDGIVGLADLQTHAGYITICDMANNELVRAEFPATPGVGVQNAVSVLAGPVASSNVYKAKLNPGTYKLRAWSLVNTMTIKRISLALWS
ncbi:MAG: hypothetical protein RLZZ237_1179 [Pseudomonadota bacterium]|jgi:hypothetical protein